MASSTTNWKPVNFKYLFHGSSASPRSIRTKGIVPGPGHGVPGVFFDLIPRNAAQYGKRVYVINRDQYKKSGGKLIRDIFSLKRDVLGSDSASQFHSPSNVPTQAIVASMPSFDVEMGGLQKYAATPKAFQSKYWRRQFKKYEMRRR